jgi:hypothetical protein
LEDPPCSALARKDVPALIVRAVDYAYVIELEAAQEALDLEWQAILPAVE